MSCEKIGLSLISILITRVSLARLTEVREVNVTARVDNIPRGYYPSAREQVKNDTAEYYFDLRFVIEVKMQNGNSISTESFRNQKQQENMRYPNERTSLIYWKHLNISPKAQLTLSVSIYDYDQSNYYYSNSNQLGHDQLIQSCSGLMIPNQGNVSFRPCTNPLSADRCYNASGPKLFSNMTITFNISVKSVNKDSLKSLRNVCNQQIEDPVQYVGNLRLNVMSRHKLKAGIVEFIISEHDTCSTSHNSWFRMRFIGDQYVNEAIYAEEFASSKESIVLEITMTEFDEHGNNRTAAGRVNYKIRVNFATMDTDGTIGITRSGSEQVIHYEVRGLSKRLPATCPTYTAEIAIEKFKLSEVCYTDFVASDPWIQLKAETSQNHVQMIFENHFRDENHADMIPADKPNFRGTAFGLSKREINLIVTIADDSSKVGYAPFFTTAPETDFKVVVHDQFYLYELKGKTKQHSILKDKGGREIMLDVYQAQLSIK